MLVERWNQEILLFGIFLRMEESFRAWKWWDGDGRKCSQAYSGKEALSVKVFRRKYPQNTWEMVFSLSSIEVKIRSWEIMVDKKLLCWS